MFGKSTDKRLARDADKIVSLKEDMDALSWSRILEIGGLLQEDISQEMRIDLAHELSAIAQSNLSLNVRLGIDPSAAPPRVMASGIEVLEGGLAEAALQHQAEMAELESEFEFEPELGPNLKTELETEPAPEPEAEPEAEPEVKPEPTPEPEPEEPHPSEVGTHDDVAPTPDCSPRFAQFRNLYESRDGSLCVFEDASGHLVAVNASKLA